VLLKSILVIEVDVFMYVKIAHKLRACYLCIRYSGMQKMGYAMGPQAVRAYPPTQEYQMQQTTQQPQQPTQGPPQGVIYSPSHFSQDLPQQQMAPPPTEASQPNPYSKGAAAGPFPPRF
jgi:hypothetical protein